MKFCLLCGNTLIMKEVDEKTRLGCTNEGCGFVFWDNPTPVIGGIVETSEGVVLCHNRLWPSGINSIITGFLERGESPEDGIIRETYEELGLEGIFTRLVGVYPFIERNQIILVYHVTAKGTICLGEEIDSIRLYTREELKGWPFGQEKLKGWPFGAGYAITDWLQQEEALL